MNKSAALSIIAFLFFAPSLFAQPHRGPIQTRGGRLTPPVQRNLETPPDEDLYGVSKGVMDAGYSVMGKNYANGKLDIIIKRISGWGGDEQLFKGSLSLFVVMLNNKKAYELRDREVNPTTVIRLIPNGDDKLIKVNGKDMENAQFSTIGCRLSSKFERSLQ